MNILGSAIKTLGTGAGKAASFAASSAMSGASTLAGGFQSVDPLLAQTLTTGLSGLSKGAEGLASIRDKIGESISLASDQMIDEMEITKDASIETNSQLMKISDDISSRDLVDLNTKQLERLTSIEQSLGNTPSNFDKLEEDRESKDEPYIQRETTEDTGGFLKLFAAPIQMIKGLETLIFGVFAAKLLAWSVAIGGALLVVNKHWENIKEIMGPIMEPIIEGVKQGWEDIKIGAEATADWVITNAPLMWEESKILLERIQTKGILVWDSIYETVVNFGKKTKDRFNYFFGLGKYDKDGERNSLADEAKEAGKAVKDGIGNLFTEVGTAAVDAIRVGVGLDSNYTSSTINGTSVPKGTSLSGSSNITQRSGVNAVRDHIIDETIKMEGGSQIVNEPLGGIAKFGINSQAQRKILTPQQIKNMSRDDAEKFYIKHYWKPIRADEMPPATAMEAFDFAVQHGVKGAARIINKAFGNSGDAITDKTIAGINSMEAAGSRSIINAQRANKLMGSNLGRTNIKGASGRWKRVSAASSALLTKTPSPITNKPSSSSSEMIEVADKANSMPKAKVREPTTVVIDNTKKVTSTDSTTRSSRPVASASVPNTLQQALNRDFINA